MFDLMEPDDIVVEIIMERQTHKGAFLLVEGRNDQRSLYENIDFSKCSVVIAGGKPDALHAQQSFDEDGFSGVLCLIDDDFTEPDYESENVIRTEFHDMDIAIFESPALGRFLLNKADPDKFKNLMGDSHNYREAVYSAAKPLACLRALSSNINLNLNFKKLKITFIDENSLAVDEDAMINAVIENSRGHYDFNDIKYRIGIISRQNHPYERLCHGHDVMTVVGISLIRCIADIRNKHRDCQDSRTWGCEIESDMRLAYREEDFQKTTMYSKITQWETDNPNYQILIH